MLKTRLAEKDAQLMGGFGALSNMQLGGAQGWLGGLPDPDSIAAALPNQARPYIQPQLHPHPSPPRKAAWGTKRGGDHLFTGRESSPKGASTLTQKLPALVQSADAHLQTVAKPAQSTAANGWQSQPRRKSMEGPLAPGLNAASPEALQQPEGSLKEPSQARPVLLPLSTSQNGMQLLPTARSSTASSRDSLQDKFGKLAEANTAASAAAVPESSIRVQSAEFLHAPDVQLAAAGDNDNSESDQNTDSFSESEFSETDSEAADTVKAPTQPMPDNAALQQPVNDRSIAADSAPSNDLRDGVDDESWHSQRKGGEIVSDKPKKKWHIW